MKQFTALIISIVVATFFVGVYVFVFFQVSGFVTRIGSATADARILSGRDSALQTTEVFLSEVREFQEILERSIVLSEDVVRAIELLESTAREEDVDLLLGGVGLADVKTWNYHERVDITFSAEGSFSDLATFLSIVEGFPIMTQLGGGSMEKSAKNNWSGTFTVSFIKAKL